MQLKERFTPIQQAKFIYWVNQMISEREVEQFSVYHLWDIKKKSPGQRIVHQEDEEEKRDEQNDYIWEMTDSEDDEENPQNGICLLYTSPSPRD